MHGPYTARVSFQAGDTIDLDESDVREGDAIASRFYQRGGVGTLDGFTRAATFSVAILLTNGERADVEIVGREGTEGASRPCQASGPHTYCFRCHGTGREAARDVVARRVSLRRDPAGRLVSSLGSRFGERIFQSV